VRRVCILAPARRDIAAIYEYIESASGSDATARKFTRLLTDECRHLGRLPTIVGRVRPELGPDIRSFPFKNYILLMRYVGNTLEIVNVIEGHRDIKALFREDDR
jgi:plasmid stabilization system protein ParE